ncbi:MAG: cupin domain-containing protein [Candidatus Riflebacteria bacterium]|nr:cupin domain-containing protein [Candidatus Riflebacteria bacterium]
MYVFHKDIPKEDLGKGVLFQFLGASKNLDVFHWNMDDGAVVVLHSHPSEQFGYCIKGGFDMTIGDDHAILKAGDAYFIPANVPHTFTALGETEAIDVFSPVKKDLPNGKSLE